MWTGSLGVDVVTFAATPGSYGAATTTFAPPATVPVNDVTTTTTPAPTTTTTLAPTTTTTTTAAPTTTVTAAPYNPSSAVYRRM
jgi:hypothetical protein